MKIAVLGTGMVGSTIASKLVEAEHPVMMGSRSANSEAGRDGFARSPARRKSARSPIQRHSVKLFCSLAALRQAGARNLRGKILIHVSNPLDFSNGMPPTLTVCNTDSLGAQVQREFPDVRVVKALNMMNCEIRVLRSLLPGDHDLFICGNDAWTKGKVTGWLCEWFGWKGSNITDLGDIAGERGMEMWMPI
jgi:predicted dinucleotide-binding enzyme